MYNCGNVIVRKESHDESQMMCTEGSRTQESWKHDVKLLPMTQNHLIESWKHDVKLLPMI